MTGILYISYDGMLEPLGQSQVISYLERLALEFPIHLVSFEKSEDWAKEESRAHVKARLDSAGIVWRPLRYHKRPSALATSYDIAQGAWLGRRLVRQYGLSIVHARSYVPSVMALAIKRLTGAQYIFDMRGFWADERVDGGLWPRNSALYRVAKGFERRFLLSADAVISLTHAGRRELERFPYLRGRLPPITVIPTCADLERFRPTAAKEAMPFTLGYVGGAGTWYLFDEALKFFKALKLQRPDARLLILNRNEHTFIRAKIAAAAISGEDVDLVAVNHSEVPGVMQQMNAGLVLVKPVYSKTASAPTKLAEFLGCGIPCLVNAGVGDMAGIVAESGVGVVIGEFSEGGYAAAVGKLLSLAEEGDISLRCAAAAHRHFSLENGVGAYAGVYRSLNAARALT